MKAADLVAICIASKCSVGTAESITAGLVASAIADVPGCSSVFRGGVVAYDPRVKRDLLGVDPVLLAHVVSRAVATDMAVRACVVLDADLGIATTGVAGPDPLDGQEPGTAWVAVHDRRTDATWAAELRLVGDRREVREACAQAALDGAVALLRSGISPATGSLSG